LIYCFFTSDPLYCPFGFQAQLKVKTATFIFSWDNLASKEEWQPILIIIGLGFRNQLQQFYFSQKRRQLQVVGTPQFEPYVLERPSN
jgi:hypothetical protein